MNEVKARTLLARFRTAWEARDLDATLNCFDDSGVYDASVDPGPGRRACGRSAVRILLSEMFDHDTGAVTDIQNEVLLQDGGNWLGWWTWIYALPGGRIERGCDRIVIGAEGILLKDAYRKMCS